MDPEVKAEGVESKLVEDPNQEDKEVTNKPHSNNNQVIITNADIVLNTVTLKNLC
jgi:hypothetical protein